MGLLNIAWSKYHYINCLSMVFQEEPVRRWTRFVAHSKRFVSLNGVWESCVNKKIAVIGLLGIVAGCGQSSEYAEETYEAAAETEAAGRVAPDIDPSAAPGVAFDYDMRLGVPDRRISELQERHADRCEELGLSRCQIVGMHYDRSDEGRVNGQLTFLLVPGDARSFAREAVASAEEMGGTLLSSQFRGEEVQTAIDDSERRESSIAERLTEIETTLNRGGLSNDRRAQLESEAAELRARQSGEQQSQQANQRRLAMSPLTINYAGEYSYGRKPLGQIGEEAMQAGRFSLTALFTVFVYLIAVFLPWLIAIGLIYYAARWVYYRYRAWRDTGEGSKAN